MFGKIYNEIDVALHKAGAGKYTSLLKKNKELRGMAKNIKRCFILATGPSIKDQDLSGLENEFCISVSNFFVHPSFNKIKPYYHIFAGSHPPITTQQMVAWWQDATKHFEKNKINVLIHARDREIEKNAKIFGHQNVYYYLDGGSFPVDFTKPIPRIQTVVHIAIHLSIYLGFKEVYLLGCDHSWLFHFRQSQHFYNEQEHSLARDNYSEWSEVKDIGYEFETYARLWKTYRKIRSEAKKADCKIYNATPQSMLDIFPGVALSDVLNTSVRS